MRYLKKLYDSIDFDTKVFSIVYSLVIFIALFVRIEVSEYIALVSTYSVIIFTVISPFYFIFKKRYIIGLIYLLLAIIFSYYFHMFYVFL